MNFRRDDLDLFEPDSDLDFRDIAEQARVRIKFHREIASGTAKLGAPDQVNEIQTTNSNEFEKLDEEIFNYPDIEQATVNRQEIENQSAEIDSEILLFQTSVDERELPVQTDHFQHGLAEGEIGFQQLLAEFEFPEALLYSQKIPVDPQVVAQQNKRVRELIEIQKQANKLSQSRNSGLVPALISKAKVQ
jgi:hypothetical protein